MKIISILGSGWLGLPLLRHFVMAGNRVNASTTSKSRMANLKSIGATPFLINIDTLNDSVHDFLKADILIVNIPSKNIIGFRQLVQDIVLSGITHIVFVSSTSVYQNINKTINESDIDCFSQSPLIEIERLFQNLDKIKTTIVRMGGLIGYNRHPGRFFSQGEAILNPESPVNLIHRDDCIGIIREIIEQDIWGEIFNCCADTHPTKREFYTHAIALIGGVPPKFGESHPNSGKLISNQKVKQRLNYEFKYPDVISITYQENTSS